MIQLRPVTEEDVPRVVKAWNASLPHEPIDDARFRATFMRDPNYERDGHLVAVRDDSIVGFVSAICRDGVPGRDGKGRPDEADRGYVRNLFGDTESTLSALLDAALGFLRDRGKTRILTGEYTGAYITPGIDSRYEALTAFLRERFDEESTLDDMEAALTAPLPNAYQRDAIRRAEEYGARVEPYAAAMLPAMREFVRALAIDQWFPPGWEKQFEDDWPAFVALRGDEIIGWTDYWPGDDALSLGPIGVSPEHRGHGIGSWLIVACMEEGVRRGYERIWAGWTNTRFYIPNGWHVFRQYIVFERRV